MSQGDVVVLIVVGVMVLGAIAELTRRPPSVEMKLAELARAMPRIREQVRMRNLRASQWTVMPTRKKVLYVGGAILFVGWPIWGLIFLLPYFVHLP